MDKKIYGKDPLTKDTIEINEWLNENDDNILIIINKNIQNLSFSRSETLKKNKNFNDKIYLLKKSFLQVPELKHIYLNCIFENQQLMINETYREKNNYYNLGYYLGKPILIDLKEIISSKFKKNRIFKINFLNHNFNKYINKESILLSQINLSNKNLLKIPKNADEKEKKRILDLNKKENIINKKNLPIKKNDVYFEEILAKALTNYSYQWDVPINLYLRTGESYFTTSIFKQYYKRYGKTPEEAISAIKERIFNLDRVFNEVAQRNESSNVFYYRGMQRPFEKLENIGDKETISNFISISTSFNVALRFSGVLRGTKCCLYKIILDKGIPYIDMVKTTKFVNEKEILLPRNLIFELVKIEGIQFGLKKEIIPIACVRVHLQDTKQFKITNNCKDFLLGSIEPFKLPYIKNDDKTKKTKQNISKDNNNKPLVITDVVASEMNSHKIPLTGKRCPKGYRIHKPTNMCEFYQNVVDKKTTQTTKTSKTTKLPKCKKGTRRNPKTGNCEAKKN